MTRPGLKPGPLDAESSVLTYHLLGHRVSQKYGDIKSININLLNSFYLNKCTVVMDTGTVPQPFCSHWLTTRLGTNKATSNRNV